MRNQAKWHKSYHLEFCVIKLQRARKRERNDATNSSTPHKTKKYSDIASLWTRAAVYSVKRRMDSFMNSELLMEMKM